MADGDEGEAGGKRIRTTDYLPKELTVEARLTAIETHLSYLKEDVGELKTEAKEGRRVQDRDFRLLFGGLIAVALGLAALMAKGFHWI